MIKREDIGKLNDGFAGRSPEELLNWGMEAFGAGKIALSSSLGAEDQVLTDMILKIDPEARIFTIDTGRLPQATYDTISETMAKYSIKYDILFPEKEEVEIMEKENGPNLFLENIVKRKFCCEIRKIRPLRKHLSKLDAWICGLRREQSVTRTGVEKIEWDANFRLVKLNPLADWTEAEVWSYIRRNKVPYNKLHDFGYPSIGCGPCTRAVKAGEHPRAGRWWWETPDKKECGLHVVK